MKKTLSGVPRLEKIKIIFQYLLVFISSFFCGCFFTQLISQSVLFEIEKDLIYHFEIPFVECKSFFELFQVFIKLTIKDIVCFAILFFSVFTVFNYIISDLIIFYVGFDFGFSVCLLLKLFLNSGAYIIHSPNGIEIFIFIATRLIFIASILYFSIKLSLGAFKMKALKPNGRFTISLPAFAYTSFLTVLGICISVLLKLLYCFIIYKF